MSLTSNLKTMNKITPIILRKFLLSITLFVLTVGFGSTAFAGLPTVYPTYGYSEEENLCKIKQSSVEAAVQENLEGEYSNLRDCRVENPKVFLNTGSGIAIWFIIFSLAFASNFYIYPRFQKKSDVEKRSAWFSDLTVIGSAVFFILLLEHYFSVPYVYYDYGSDIDHIIYSNFIHPQVPTFYALAYLLSILLRVAWLFLRKKGVGPLRELRQITKNTFLCVLVLSVFFTGLLSLIPFGGGNCEGAEPGGVPESWWGFPLPFYECGVWGQAFHPIFIPINFLFVWLVCLLLYSLFRMVKPKR